MTLDEVLLGVKNQSNIDISCSHSWCNIFTVIIISFYFIKYSYNIFMNGWIDETETETMWSWSWSNQGMNDCFVFTSMSGMKVLNWCNRKVEANECTEWKWNWRGNRRNHEMKEQAMQRSKGPIHSFDYTKWINELKGKARRRERAIHSQSHSQFNSLRLMWIEWNEDGIEGKVTEGGQLKSHSLNHFIRGNKANSMKWMDWSGRVTIAASVPFVIHSSFTFSEVWMNWLRQRIL